MASDDIMPPEYRQDGLRGASEMTGGQMITVVEDQILNDVLRHSSVDAGASAISSLMTRHSFGG
jgi:hypothetical protein